MQATFRRCRPFCFKRARQFGEPCLQRRILVVLLVRRAQIPYLRKAAASGRGKRARMPGETSGQETARTIFLLKGAVKDGVLEQLVVLIK